MSGKAGEGWRGLSFGLEFAEFLPGIPALTACESDVGLVGAGFGDKPATRRRGHDALLQLKQLGREPNSGDENPGVVEGAESFDLYWNGRRTQLVQACDKARELLRAGIAEKLEGNMPCFRRRPAKAVRGGLKPSGDRREFVDDRSRQRDSDKQAHTGIMELLHRFVA